MRSPYVRAGGRGAPEAEAEAEAERDRLGGTPVPCRDGGRSSDGAHRPALSRAGPRAGTRGVPPASPLKLLDERGRSEPNRSELPDVRAAAPKPRPPDLEAPGAAGRAHPPGPAPAPSLALGLARAPLPALAPVTELRRGLPSPTELSTRELLLVAPETPRLVLDQDRAELGLPTWSVRALELRGFAGLPADR